MKRTKLTRIAAAALMCALLLASLSSCASWDNFYNAFIKKEEAPAKTVRVAVFEPLSGTDAGEAEAEIEGIRLANSLYPYANGSKVELVFYDNKSDTETAALIAAEIARDETISMVIGTYGNMLTIASADIFAEAGLPTVNATSTNPIISNTTNFVCAAAVDAFPARAAAEFAVNVLGHRTLAAMYSSADELSKIRAQEFSRYCEQTYKIASVPVIAVNEGADLYFIMKALEDSGATAVYMPAGTSISEAVMAKAEESGLNLVWMGGDAWKNLGISDVYYTADYDPFSDITEMNKIFSDAYGKKHGASIPSEKTALGFDAYLMALEALNTAEDPDSRESLCAALMAIDGLEGATGHITISLNGSPVKSVRIYRTTSEEPELVYTPFEKTPAEEEPEDSNANTGN